MMYNVLMDNVQAVKEKKIDNKDVNALPAWKIFLYATIGLIGLSALIGIFLIIFSDSGFVKDSINVLARIAGTTSILGLFCLLTMNHIFRCKHKKQLVRVAATAGLIMNIIWLIPWMLILWNAFDTLQDRCEYPSYTYYNYRYGSDAYERAYQERERKYNEYQKCMEPYENAVEISWKTVATAGALAILLTLIANYVIFENYNNAIRALKVTAIVCGILLVSTLILTLDFEVRDLGETFWKLMAIVGIVFVFAVIITPILVKVQKKKLEAEKPEKEKIAAPITKPLFPKTEEESSDNSDLKEQIKAELREEMKGEEGEKELREKIEKELREKIEKEVRAEIEAEMKAKESESESEGESEGGE